MTIKQAQQELARPLVFGDELQIKALKVLNNAPSDPFHEAIYDLLSDWSMIDDDFNGLTEDEFMAEVYNLFKQQALEEL